MKAKTKRCLIAVAILLALCGYLVGYGLFRDYHCIVSGDGSGQKLTGIPGNYPNAVLTALFFPLIKLDHFVTRRVTFWIWGDGELSFL